MSTVLFFVGVTGGLCVVAAACWCLAVLDVMNAAAEQSEQALDWAARLQGENEALSKRLENLEWRRDAVGRGF